MAKRKLGGFVSVAGGLKNGIINGENLDINSILIHPSPPQRWCTKPFDEENIKEFNKAKKDSDVENVYMHGIYLTNLANPDKQKFHLGKLALVHYLDLCEKVDGDGVMFHTGSFRDTTPEEGTKRIIKGLDWIIKESTSTKTDLMLEVAAGSKNVVGDKFDELARIRDGVANPDRIFFCLDTAHMFASGYDIVNDLDGVIEEMDNILGIENVKCVHFNDSKVEFNSKKDRHENIGDGHIGESAMKAFLNHPKLKHLPFLMETPALKKEEGARSQVKKLKEWAE